MILAMALAAVGLLVGGDFFTSRNVMSMGFQLAEFGFLALAMALAMLSGGIDLSVIGNMNLSGILAGLLLTNSALTGSLGGGVSVAAAVAMALAASAAFGFLKDF
jgi:simple sugar transport system permease protein